jgi:hypothetical protein
MKVIVVLDDDNGMMFNHRRQSQDAVLRCEILRLVGGNRLYMSEYSYGQFIENDDNIIVDDRFLIMAGNDDYCFVEDEALRPIKEKIQEFVVFRWNRKYPSDKKIDLLPDECGFECKYEREFRGRSHDNITMQIWG